MCKLATILKKKGVGKANHKIQSRVLKYFDVVGTLILALASVVVIAFFKGVAFLPSFEQRQIAAYVASSVLLAWILSTGIFQFVFRCRSLRYMIFYPAVSFVIIAILSLFVMFVPSEIIERRFVVASIVVLGAAIIQREVLNAVRKRISCNLTNYNVIRADMPPGLEWIGLEEPISNIDDDHFGHNMSLSSFFCSRIRIA